MNTAAPLRMLGVSYTNMSTIFLRKTKRDSNAQVHVHIKMQKKIQRQNIVLNQELLILHVKKQVYIISDFDYIYKISPKEHKFTKE